jgi:hypothetical protein
VKATNFTAWRVVINFINPSLAAEVSFQADVLQRKRLLNLFEEMDQGGGKSADFYLTQF